MTVNIDDDDDWHKNAMDETSPLSEWLSEVGRLGAQDQQQQRPDRGGLNLSASSPVAASPGLNLGASQETDVPVWAQVLKGIAGGVEAFGAGFQGREPLFMKQQQQDELVKYRREIVANQIKAREDRNKEQQFTNFISLDKQLGADPDQWEQQMKLAATQGNPHARLALEVGDKKMRGEYESVLPLINTYFPEFGKKYDQNPNGVGKSELRAVLNNVSKIKDRRALADADASEYGALQKIFEQSQSTGTPMNPGDLERFQQLHSDKTKKSLELEKLQADLGLTKAQTLKVAHEAEVGTRPDRSLANKVHQSMFGVPFEQGNEESQAAALKSYFAGSAQGHQQVTENIPVSQTGKAQEFRDPVTGQAAPGWATPKQLAELGFVNIEPSQAQTVNSIRNVDALMKEIKSAGSSLLRKETGAGNLADIPMGFLQIPIVKLIKKYAGDPDAQLLQSDIARVAPALARLAGDTGNIALAEQEMYQKAVFSDADTLESFSGKIQSIDNAQARTRSSLGFVPDEKAYLRRLIIQGKTDEQIKAIVAERKRFQ
jgi:hypothetical protein